MRALLSVTVLVAGCAMTESERVEANYNDLAGKVTESCGTFRTRYPTLLCSGPDVDVTPISTCLTTHLADLVPARADGFTGVTSGDFDMGRVSYTSETFLFVVDGGVTLFEHTPAHTSHDNWGDPTEHEETWTEAHCTGIAIANATSICPSVVGTGCDVPPL